MGRIAHNDPVFGDDFVVESVDERCWNELTPSLKALVLAEAAAGNKATGIGSYGEPRRIHVQLPGPAKQDLSKLAEGLVLRKGFTKEFPVYDSELYAVFDLTTMHFVSFGDPSYEGPGDGT
jgi:hypothetical protein